MSTLLLSPIMTFTFTVNGKVKPVPLLNMDVAEITERVTAVRNSTGIKQKIVKRYNVGIGAVPSIQGAWNEDIDVKGIVIQRVTKDDISL